LNSSNSGKPPSSDGLKKAKRAAPEDRAAFYSLRYRDVQTRCSKAVSQIEALTQTPTSPPVAAGDLPRGELAFLSARQHGVPVFKYSRADVYSTFASAGFSNKQTLAELIAKHIPAFEQHVPPPRKPWKSEDARMALFDAAALALVFFQKAATGK
jgi:hypothetical protein